MRREALLGLSELLGASPWLLTLHAAPLLGGLGPRLTDSDREVRSAALGLLRDRLLAGLPPAALAPFLPALAAHLAAAMTHMEEGVRRDAVLFLGALFAATFLRSHLTA